MLRNTRWVTQTRSGKSGALCLDMMCRDFEIGLDPLKRASREASRILNTWGVDLDPNRTISEQANDARKEGAVWGVALCRLLDQIDPGHCEKQIPGPGLSGKTADSQIITGGLKVEMVRKLNDLSRIAGSPDPQERIISGYRTPTEQATLRNRWVAGEREGIAARPADPRTSRHPQGIAVDLWGSNDELFKWGRLWEELGGRWGGRFWPKPDLVHFDLR